MSKFRKLGIEVKDSVTGLVGVITAKVSYITGCDQYLVQPQGDGTKYPDASWIDDSRLTKTGKGVVIETDDIESENPVAMFPMK